jgi:phage terminase small subunit
MTGQLKERQEKFCQSYLINKNATQSAISAGYSDKSAHNQGYRLLQEPAYNADLKSLKKNTAQT